MGRKEGEWEKKEGEYDGRRGVGGRRECGMGGGRIGRKKCRVVCKDGE